jgi:phosphatidylinositol alpha-1,6-mannosyltransferase
MRHERHKSPICAERERLRIFTEHFPNQDGGIARWAFAIARNLALESISVEVFAPKKCFKDGTADPSPASLSVMLGRNWHGMRNVYMLYYTLKALMSSGRTPFLCACWDMATVPVFLSKLLGFPVFVGAHGLEVARAKRGLERRLMAWTLAGSSGVVAVSRFTRSLVEEATGGRARVDVIGCGVDTEAFTPGPKPAYLIDRYDLMGKRVLLTLARITERKGHEVVIRALPRVLSSCPDVVYLVAGKGGHRRQLLRLVGELGLEKHVLFCGYVPPEELADHYNLCDVYVMISKEIASTGDVEGFGITYLEAGACAKPVVAGESGGVVDAVEDGVNGLTVPPGDAEAAAEAIIHILVNRDAAEKLGNAGRQRAEESRDWRIVAGQLKSAMGLDTQPLKAAGH